MTFERFLTTFDPFWAFLEPKTGQNGPKWEQNGSKMVQKWVQNGHFGVILDYFWVNPGSFWGRLGIILASFWHYFRVVLVSFWPRFEAFWGAFWGYFWTIFDLLGGLWTFLGQNPVILGGFGGQKMDWNPKPLFWRGHWELSIREGTRANGHE